MKLVVSEHAGFCPGVTRADITIQKLISENKDSKIYTLGHLIHNRIYNSELENKGIGSVSSDEISDIIKNHPNENHILVIRTHGITKEENKKLLLLEKKNKNFKLVDMTCIYVKKIHKIADENTNDKTVFLLFSDPNHPEAIGTMSYANGEKYAFSSLDELKSIKIGDKTPILCSQTTQNLKEYKKIKKFLEKLYTNLIFFDTICDVTEKRQNEAIEIAKSSEAMIVIGGKESSNTHKLFDLCKTECKNTVWIEEAAELDSSLFPDGAQSIGITAGASTPRDKITEVFKEMQHENDFKAMLEDSLKTLHTGDTVTGTVVTIGKNEIKLDLGTKVTGVLQKEQITDDPAANLSEMFKVGDEVTVFVIQVKDSEGIARLDKKRVDADNSWVVLKEAYDNGEILEGNVTSVIKGGVIVTTNNNRVFVPASQTGLARGADLNSLLGTTQRVKLLEFDVNKKRALGSIKVVLAAEKKAKEDAVWATLEVGRRPLL